MRRLFGLGFGIAVLLLVQGYVGGQKVTPQLSFPDASPSPAVPAATSGRLPTLDAPAPLDATPPPTSIEDALGLATRGGKPVPITITYTERQLTTAAAAHFPFTYAGASLTDPVIRLRNGQLSLDTAASLAFLKTTARVVTTPTVTAGRPSVRVDSATLAGQSVPEAARGALATNIARAIASDLPAKLVVSSIAVGTGTLTMQGTANP
jgi:hypothetical protein